MKKNLNTSTCACGMMMKCLLASYAIIDDALAAIISYALIDKRLYRKPDNPAKQEKLSIKNCLGTVKHTRET